VLETTLGIRLLGLGLIWGVTIGAAVLRSFTGFGFALAAVPVFALFLAPTEAVVLSVCLSLGVGLQTLPQYAGKIPLAPLWPLYLMALVGTVAGASLLQSMSADVFRLAIGVTVILASVVLSRYHPRRREAGLITRGGAGLTSGLINGAFAIPGPPIIVYAMATEADPARARALMIGYFTFAAVVALASYAAAGLVGWQSLYLFLLAYPAMFVGDKLGYALFLRHGGALYRRIAIVTLFLVGLSLLVRSAWG